MLQCACASQQAHTTCVAPLHSVCGAGRLSLVQTMSRLPWFQHRAGTLGGGQVDRDSTEIRQG